MDATICQAIQWRNVITFEYNGGQRTVEPYIFGMSDAGVALWGYQVEGFSEFGESEGWKLFDFDKISTLMITSDVFIFNQLDYRPDLSPILKIYCSVR